LQVRQGQVFAEDLDSTNGTYVNGQRLAPQTPQPVGNGDEIRLGRFMLRLQW
jgi:pSer/pThr/pTyr-binding forkhead associated (FHA) protein